MSKEPDSQEQQEKFINEFKSLTQTNLIEYEKENRGKINTASREVRNAFDDKWKKVIGISYWQPVTSQKVYADPKIERVDPKSNNYMINGEEGFWEVIFSAKSNPNDQNDVTLTVNGECLSIIRNKPVILPGRFLECADHGEFPTYKQEPGQPRKITSHVKFFPYTTMRQATKAEYIKMRADGDRITREKREFEERI